jgi:hypothetical protein
MSRETKSISSKSGFPPDQQMPIEEAVEIQPTEATFAAPGEKPKFSKYLVQCKYHMTGSIAYRIYAANESDAEDIGRLRFAEDGNRNRLLDGVRAIQVVNEY